MAFARGFGVASRRGRLVWLPLLATALMLTACGEDEFARVDTPNMVVTPSVLGFESLEIGLESVQFLTISNEGDGTLIVQSIDLNTRSSEFSLANVSFPIRLERGQSRQVEVYYTPADCSADRGSLVIYSNDPDSADTGFSVPLQPQELTGQIRVNPNPVDFGRVPAGESRTLTVKIENVGTCALTVNDLFLSGSFDFQFTEPAEDGVIELEPALPITLETSESRELDITYTPSGDGFDEATMFVRSDDSQNRTVEVPVFANGNQPCIVVSEEDGIDFGQRFIGEVHSKNITITNCSQRQPLEVYDVELGEHWDLQGLERFFLTDLPDFDAEPVVLDPQTSTSVTLNFDPVLYTPDTHPDLCTGPPDEPCEVTDGAVMTVTSSDEEKSPLDIEVRGVGTNNHCPVAVARARIRGSGDPWTTTIDAIPLDTLEFDGRDSTDSEGDIAAYQWEVSDRPSGSVADFSPNGAVPNPTFFLDLAGTYVFTLNVFDGAGTISCDPAEVVAVVTPDEAIHVQLVWHTPGDPDETDRGGGRGSDVDLHFLHPLGSWDVAPYDCFWRNKEPNWGDRNSSADDPSLDIDDTDGAGPENINLNEPEGSPAEPFTYQVGVFYYSDHNYGPSDSTVRIFINGHERFAATFPNLEDRQFWDVARIEWPSAEITRIHRLYPSGFP